MHHVWHSPAPRVVEDAGDNSIEFGRVRNLAAIRGGIEALGMLSLLHDLGVDITSTLRLDASAALGILQRKGVGKIRHLDVGCLWLQEKEAREQIRLAKEPGETNPADIGTKNLSEEVMLRHLARMSCEYRDGRPEVSAKVLALSEPQACESLAPASEKLIKRGGWFRESDGRWMRKDKGARALRGFQGCAEAGIDIETVVGYVVEDNYSGKKLADIDVRGRTIDDPVFIANFHRPVDIVSRITCAVAGITSQAATSINSLCNKKSMFLGSFVGSRVECAESEPRHLHSVHTSAVDRTSNFGCHDGRCTCHFSSTRKVSRQERVDSVGEDGRRGWTRTGTRDCSGGSLGRIGPDWRDRTGQLRFSRCFRPSRMFSVHEAYSRCASELDSSQYDSVSHVWGSRRACTHIDDMHRHIASLVTA